MLLDLVCIQFGVRFKKNVDGPRLAALMEVTEIDPKIKEIVGEIAGA
jgi:hypothetical protein